MSKTKLQKRLTGLPPEVQREGYDITGYNYHKARDLAINGAIPAFQVNNIWHFDISDTALIAETLGLRRIEKRAAA